MRLRLVIALLLAVLGVVVNVPTNASATGDKVVVGQPSDVVEPSTVLITAFNIDSSLNFVELHNTSTTPVDLSGWKLMVYAHNEASELPVEVTLSGFLLGKSTSVQYGGYMVAGDVSMITNPDIGFSFSEDVYSQLATMKVSRLQLVDSTNVIVDDSTIPEDTSMTGVWAQRKSTSSGKYTDTGSFSDFTLLSGVPVLQGGSLYEPPEVPFVKVVEILANARSCAPTDKSLDCYDYIKIYNPTTADVDDLSMYRLRTDSGGSKSSTSNTFSLVGELKSGEYKTVYLRDNGETISITNTGGYVWLEDAYGLSTYEPMYAYADASADSKKGSSWAYDELHNDWKWAIPAPSKKNIWATESTQEVLGAAAAFTPCGVGQERNPDTNRCRNVVATTAGFVPCTEGQERNPDTNRCRSLSSATTALLVPCSVGQERNPDTNRCRKVASAESELKPCDPGQERNPETNRCRKVSALSTDGTAAGGSDTKTEQSTFGLPGKASWWLTGLILVGVAGYGTYEWRRELATGARSLRRRFTGKS